MRYKDLLDPNAAAEASNQSKTYKSHSFHVGPNYYTTFFISTANFQPLVQSLCKHFFGAHTAGVQQSNKPCQFSDRKFAKLSCEE